jgi:hypothetical protein
MQAGAAVVLVDEFDAHLLVQNARLC